MRIDKATRLPNERALATLAILCSRVAITTLEHFTYLSRPILRRAFRLRQLPLPTALAPVIQTVVAAALGAPAHDVLPCDGRIDVVAVRTRRAALRVAVAMRRVRVRMRCVDHGGQLRS
jgi:hypothetical protein